MSSTAEKARLLLTRWGRYLRCQCSTRWMGPLAPVGITLWGANRRPRPPRGVGKCPSCRPCSWDHGPNSAANLLRSRNGVQVAGAGGDEWLDDCVGSLVSFAARCGPKGFAPRRRRWSTPPSPLLVLRSPRLSAVWPCAYQAVSGLQARSARRARLLGFSAWSFRSLSLSFLRWPSRPVHMPTRAPIVMLT